MKRNNLIKTAAAGFFVFAILVLLNLVAAEVPVSASLTYGDVDLSDASTAPGANSVPAFSLTIAAASIELEDGTTTDTLLFVSESGFEGIYFDGTDEIALYDSESFTLNGAEYTIERTGTGTAASYRISSTEDDSLMIGTQAANTLILPDNGRNAKIVVGSRQVTKPLPAAVIFNSRSDSTDAGAMAEAESDAAERSSVSGAASEDAEPGCSDNDADEEDDGIYAPSHVSVINDDGTETVTADYCARRGDVTRLYEAICTAENTAIVRMVVCPEDKVCMQGACREPGADVAGKYCLDSDVMTADSPEALSNTAATKGTTVGFYTAACSGDDECRPFSAWSDYCRDDKTLIEYYCSEESRQGLFREIICPESCEDGKCSMPPYCYDSDGGSFETVKGTVKGVTASGEYYSNDDSCANANTVQEYSCDEFDEVDAFKTENKACGAGKYCSEGKCVSGEMLCNQCDPLNDFNIKEVKEGTACNADGTPSAWNLKRCPAGQYCSANACVAEPKATMEQVTDAFNHRKKWALLLNETLGWIETAKQIEPVISPAYGDIMEEIASGLSGTQTLILRRQI